MAEMDPSPGLTSLSHVHPRLARGLTSCDRSGMKDDIYVPRGQNPAAVGALIARTGILLGMGHAELAKHLEISRRSVSRWTSRGTQLNRRLARTLAELTYARDKELAAQIAAVVGETLVSLGIESLPLPRRFPRLRPRPR